VRKLFVMFVMVLALASVFAGVARAEHGDIGGIKPTSFTWGR
jgi:hypothetical protein